MADLLEFEEPIGILQKEIQALSMLPSTADRQRDIARLEARIQSIRQELYTLLTPWQRVLVARHPARPTTLDYVEQLFTDFVEIRGDRRFADDHAIVAGPAVFHGQPVMIVGHQKGSDTKQKIYRNFGYARPEGYRKALRAMQLAEKFGRPIVCFVDTPAAEAERFLVAHPDLYENRGGTVQLAIHDGDLLTRSLTAPGFASAVHPDWSTIAQLAQPKTILKEQTA